MTTGRDGQGRGEPEGAPEAPRGADRDHPKPGSRTKGIEQKEERSIMATFPLTRVRVGAASSAAVVTLLVTAGLGNQALAQVHQDGTFRKLEKQYFDFDIYPGH